VHERGREARGAAYELERVSGIHFDPVVVALEEADRAPVEDVHGRYDGEFLYHCVNMLTW
jgi:hypothetical protein